ncbi:LOW QUALITY PROTEIN: glucan endo-1,3-beta-glucosidase 3 [Quercus suber]|uniref:LOW QUALITY PROTEIN: glucan endo-1,3-beta-glucosidase 3 n=1 Tax=Quercus suber TaxID=58331 RepID=UPI0032DEB0E2
MAMLLLFFLLAVSVVSADEDAFIGVNLGTDVSNMPSPTQVVALLKAQNIRHVRLYDADRAMLLALANTGIQVTVAVPNDQLLGIGQSNATAANWVTRNVLAHVPATNITAIAVGSEVLTTLPNAAPVLVSALKFIHSALVASNLDRQIKVSTAFNAYFQQMAKSPGTCDFKGVATITTTDPSHGTCIVPGSVGKNGTIVNGTSLAPSSNSTILAAYHNFSMVMVLSRAL